MLTVYRVLACILHVLNPEKGAVGTVVMFFTDEERKAHRELPRSHRHTPEGGAPHAPASEQGLNSAGAFPANTPLMRPILQIQLSKCYNGSLWLQIKFLETESYVNLNSNISQTT